MTHEQSAALETSFVALLQVATPSIDGSKLSPRNGLLFFSFFGFHSLLATHSAVKRVFIGLLCHLVCYRIESGWTGFYRVLLRKAVFLLGSH